MRYQTPENRKLPIFFSTFSFAIGFFGFNFFLLCIVALGLGENSRFFSIIYRAGFLAFSIIAILYGTNRNAFGKIGVIWLPLIVFWSLYFLQIAKDCYFMKIDLGMSPSEYIQKALGMTFIPMLVFLIQMSDGENKWAFRTTWITILGCCAFSLIFYREILGQGYRMVRHSSFGAGYLISPQLLSYIGAITVCIAEHLFLMKLKTQNSKVYKVSLCGILFLGMALVLMGGTRSALLACTFISVVIFLANSSESSFNYKIKVSIAFILIGLLFSFAIWEYGSQILDRFSGLSAQLSGESEGRMSIYRDTLLQIWDSPFWGSGLEVKTTRFYPHNHILEAFMATGIFGGAAFIVLSLAAVIKSYRILKLEKAYGWIACLFLVFYFRGMFSGSIINAHMWYAMMAVFAVAINQDPGGSGGPHMSMERKLARSLPSRLPKYGQQWDCRHSMYK